MNRTAKRLASLTLALVFLLTLLPGGVLAASIVDSGTCGTSLSWTLKSDGVLTISGSGAMADYTYDSPWFDYNESVKTVKIESGVTTIGNYAFFGCSRMTSITLPSSLTSIGEYAFCSCESLTSVTLPSGLTSIGSLAFYYCESLTSITIPADVTAIEYGAFFGCSSLTAINVDSGNAVFSSDNGLLYNKAKTELLYCPNGKTGSITVPSGVTFIGNFAFQGCGGVTKVTIPASVTGISSASFENCSSLTAISVKSGNTSYCSVDGVLYNKAKTELICCPAGKTGTVTIPAGVTSIGDYGFYYCHGLTGVTIPAGVESIGYTAFYGCNSLTSVTLPASLTNIEYGAFLRCTSLTAINVDSGNTVFSSANGILYNKDKTRLISCPAGKTGTVTVPAGVTIIASHGFESCSGLTKVTLPESVTTIGDYAFYYCDNLTSMTLPAGVESIESYAFYYCDNLTSITIPSSVTAVAYAAFFYTALTDVYYTGTSAQWTALLAGIEAGNEDLADAAIHFAPTITKQPSSVTAAAGGTATFKVAAIGATSYQWYYRKSSSGSWIAVSSADGKTASHAITAAAKYNGYQYRCKVSNGTSYVYTNIVTLTVG